MAGTHTLEFTETNFDDQVLKADTPVLVDFWAEWCMPCRALGPVIEELAKDYMGKVKVGKVNTDSNSKVSIQYGVTSIPTVILFHQGKMVERFIGLQGKRNYQNALEKLLNSK